MNPRTSLSHPLRIDEVACSPWAAGVVGITFCPGKRGESVHGAPWVRSLDTDLDAIRDWGCSLALTLIERHEFEMLGVPDLGRAFRARGIAWRHLPIPDLHAPTAEFLGQWPDAGAQAIENLRAGGRVLVHCRGGLGRAGTVACMLLMELGEAWPRALQRVRKARPGAVESLAQERFLGTYEPPLKRAGR